jgi:nitrite reductase/ring-hydroxylating ferredoxin subunit
MTRYEFLKNLGLKGSALFALTCLGGGAAACGHLNEDPGPTQIILDLTEPGLAILNLVGSAIMVPLNDQPVVVARVTENTVVAVTQICSHQQNRSVVFDPVASEFQCPAHGARFDLRGQGLNDLGRLGLRTYPATLDVPGNRIIVTV